MVKKLFLVVNGNCEWFTTNEDEAAKFEYYHATLEEAMYHPSLLVEEIKDYILDLVDGLFKWFANEFIDQYGEDETICGFKPVAI